MRCSATVRRGCELASRRTMSTALGKRSLVVEQTELNFQAVLNLGD
jgi:hypothetical protein